MRCLTIDITDQQHQSDASVAGKNDQATCFERLFPTGSGSDGAWGELRTLLQARVEVGPAGKISSKCIDEVLDEGLAND